MERKGSLDSTPVNRPAYSARVPSPITYGERKNSSSSSKTSTAMSTESKLALCCMTQLIGVLYCAIASPVSSTRSTHNYEREFKGEQEEAAAWTATVPKAELYRAAKAIRKVLPVFLPMPFFCKPLASCTRTDEPCRFCVSDNHVLVVYE